MGMYSIPNLMLNAHVYFLPAADFSSVDWAVTASTL